MRETYVVTHEDNGWEKPCDNLVEVRDTLIGWVILEGMNDEDIKVFELRPVEVPYQWDVNFPKRK